MMKTSEFLEKLTRRSQGFPGCWIGVSNMARNSTINALDEVRDVAFKASHQGFCEMKEKDMVYYVRLNQSKN